MRPGNSVVARSTDKDFVWLFEDAWIEPKVVLCLEASWEWAKDCIGTYVPTNTGTYTLIATDDKDITVRVELSPELYFNAKDMVKQGARMAMTEYRKKVEEVSRAARIKRELGF